MPMHTIVTDFFKFERRESIVMWRLKTVADLLTRLVSFVHSEDILPLVHPLSTSEVDKLLTEVNVDRLYTCLKLYIVSENGSESCIYVIMTEKFDNIVVIIYIEYFIDKKLCKLTRNVIDKLVGIVRDMGFRLVEVRG